MSKYIFTLAIILAFGAINTRTEAQTQLTTVKGTITDADKQTPVGFVNVYFKKTTIGTISDTTGFFKLSSKLPVDTICFSAVGYKEKKLALGKTRSQVLTVVMQPDVVSIGEIKVKPDDGPTRRLLNKVIKNKPTNNPDKYKRYTYEKYTRWEYGLNNVGDKLANSRAFKNNQNVFQSKGDSTRFLPVYFSEQIVLNEFQRDPLRQKSTILADKTSGLGVLANYEISGYTSGLDIEVNFYDNFINLFTQNFVSPLAENGWFYYKYFLKDSVTVGDHKQYTVRFIPRRKGDKTFVGEMVVEDKRYSLVEIDAMLSETGNINFLKKMRLAASFQTVNDSLPFFKTNLIEADIDYMPINTAKDKKRLEVSFSQVSSINKVQLGLENEVKLSSKGLSYESIKKNGAYNRDSSYWNGARHLQLSETDKNIYATIDSINQIPTVKTIDRLAQMYMTGYYDVGRWELGPYDYFFNFNEVEGTHLFVGARTSSEIWDNKMVWGGLGFGTRNKQLIGRLGMGYKFEAPTRRVAKIWWADDIVRIGENEKILYLYENMLSPTESNLISSMFKRDIFDELQRQQRVSANYDHEWRNGFSTKVTANWNRHFSPTFYPFVHNGQIVSSVNATELSLDFRWSWREKIIDNGFLRFFYATDYPIMHLTLGAGQTIVAGQSQPFAKVHGTLKHNVYLGQTLLMYALEGGAFAGSLPYTMLDIPRGNETYGFYAYDFNMMDYLEFTHDKYLHAYLEHHWNGFFFNRVPLMKKLRLREVVTAKALYGTLSQRHTQLLDLPNQLPNNNKPYLEVGAGVENIMRFLRLEAVWRLAPESLTGAPAFGLRMQIAIKL